MHLAPTPITRQPPTRRPLPPASAGAKAGGPQEEVATVAVLGYN